MKCVALFIILSISAFPLTASQDQFDKLGRELAKSIAQQPRIKVAVVGITNHDSRTSEGPNFVSERLTTALAKDKHFRTIERDQIIQMLAELRFSETGVMDPKTTKRVGEMLGADVIVTGTIIDMAANKSEFNVRAIFSATGRVMAATRTMLDRTWSGRHTLASLNTYSSKSGNTDPIQSLAQKLCRDIKMKNLPTVAVLDFPYNFGRISTGSILISERLVTYLVQEQIPVVERRLIESILKEKKMWETGVIDPRSIKSLGRLLGVDAVVLGTLADSPDKNLTEVLARVVHLETGEILSAKKILTERLWQDTPRLPLMAHARTPMPMTYPIASLGATVDVDHEFKEPVVRNKLNKTHLTLDGQLKKYMSNESLVRKLPYRPVAVPVLVPPTSSQLIGGTSHP